MGESKIINPPSHLKPVNIKSFEEYKKLYQQSINQPEIFWKKLAEELIDWFHPFKTVVTGNLTDANVTWFKEGMLNACFNCADRHALKNPDKIALIWEQDEPGKAQKISYQTLLENVCRVANVLTKYGIRQGDTVAIYMPMIPEAVYSILACARIGAIHSCVFAGFSADALRDRIQDASCKILITADQGKRGGKFVNLKKIADEIIDDCPSVEKVLLFQHTFDEMHTNIHKNRDLLWKDEVLSQRPYCPPVWMNAEDPLFLLYTSGSTGKPKGLLHTTGGYLLGVTSTLKYTFDLSENDIFGCVADVGWITGHSYIVYGPLSLGITTLLFESIPTFPDPGRYWRMIDEHKITHFYTAPTAIRALKRFGDEHLLKYKLDSVKVLGTVGEPINPEAWNWYYKVVGKERCAIIDTYWQTETGSFAIAPYASISLSKPGSASFPQFGIDPVILDPTTGSVVEEKEKEGVLCFKKPWPSMARTILNNHDRFINAYFTPYKGYYFSGDGCRVDADGFYWISGRVDDVINVSGHRLSTAEIESALVLHPGCSEAAVVGAPDDLTGQAIVAFCTLKNDYATEATKPKVQSELIQEVRKHIGPFATPKKIIIAPELPKTRSGKIMRRILRKIVAKESSPEELGDLSTLADPSIIEKLIELAK